MVYSVYSVYSVCSVQIPLSPPLSKGDDRGISLYPVPCTLSQLPAGRIMHCSPFTFACSPSTTFWA